MLVLRCNTLWPVMGMIWLMLWSASAPAQDTRWDVYNDAGTRAFKLGQYVEAEQQFKAALEAAETFTPPDVRLATSLSQLAELYRTQGQYARAEPLYQRALPVWEAILGLEDLRVAEVLENYAALLRKLRPFASRFPWSPAAKMATRAKHIRGSQAPNGVAHGVDNRVDQGGPGFWPIDENELFGSEP